MKFKTVYISVKCKWVSESGYIWAMQKQFYGWGNHRLRMKGRCCYFVWPLPFYLSDLAGLIRSIKSPAIIAIQVEAVAIPTIAKRWQHTGGQLNVKLTCWFSFFLSFNEKSLYQSACEQLWKYTNYNIKLPQSLTLNDLIRFMKFFWCFNFGGNIYAQFKLVLNLLFISLWIIAVKEAEMWQGSV